jgi:hypothetical protein
MKTKFYTVKHCTQSLLDGIVSWVVSSVSTIELHIQPLDSEDISLLPEGLHSDKYYWCLSKVKLNSIKEVYDEDANAYTSTKDLVVIDGEDYLIVVNENWTEVPITLSHYDYTLALEATK